MPTRPDVSHLSSLQQTLTCALVVTQTNSATQRGPLNINYAAVSHFGVQYVCEPLKPAALAAAANACFRDL